MANLHWELSQEMIASIHIDEPLRHGGLSVFPLFTQSKGVDYQLADDALAAGSVVVEETSEAGSVPELAVENKGNLRVLFLEGEELVGAKQNRVLNTSVLVPAKSRTKIPVSCVERGRWGYKSRCFGSSGFSSPSSMRRILSRSVSDSLGAGRGYRSDQREIWCAVAGQHRCLAVSSSTEAFSATIEQHRDRIAEFQENLRYVEGASGLVAAVGGKVVALDLFDKPSTCQKVWPKLLTGFAIDALQTREAKGQPDIADVQEFVKSVSSASWKPVPPAGEGEAYRAETNTNAYGSKLAFQGSIVHASILSGA